MNPILRVMTLKGKASTEVRFSGNGIIITVRYVPWQNMVWFQQPLCSRVAENKWCLLEEKPRAAPSSDLIITAAVVVSLSGFRVMVRDKIRRPCFLRIQPELNRSPFLSVSLSFSVSLCLCLCLSLSFSASLFISLGLSLLIYFYCSFLFYLYLTR